MSWTSPSPPAGSGQPPAAPPYAYPPYPPQPPTYPPPAPARRRRPGLVVLLVVLPLVLVIAAGATLITTLGGTKTLSDAQGRVGLTVPRTWSNDAGEDAGQRVDQGEDSYTVPDIETGGLLGDFAVFVEPRTTKSLADVHRAQADEECEYSGCISRGQPAATEVNGRRGLQEVLRHPEGEVTVVVTLESETLVVTVLGHGIEEDRDALTDRARTVLVNR